MWIGGSWWSASATPRARSAASWRGRGPGSRSRCAREPWSSRARCSACPIQYFSRLMAGLPRRGQRLVMDLTGARDAALPRPARPSAAAVRPCPDVPLIGFELVEAIREGRVHVRGNVSALTPEGARFADGRNGALRRRHARHRLPRDPGVPRRRREPRRTAASVPGTARVRSAEWPGLFFVGHNYDARGGLFNIARDSARAAGMLAAGLALTVAASGDVVPADHEQEAREHAVEGRWVWCPPATSGPGGASSGRRSARPSR